jgi:pyridoxine 5-phosphate synthase
MSVPYLRLGVNIDHVATVRNARGGLYPDPLRAAKLAIAAGADGITAHLREDRRHIVDTDIITLKEGGLDAAGQIDVLRPLIASLKASSIRVSLFIAPEPRQIEAAATLGAPVIEIHTGGWCEAVLAGEHVKAAAEFERIRAGAIAARGRGLEVHAGHGLDYSTAEAIAALPEIVELNIGHFLIGEAIMVGLEAAVRQMRAVMDRGRAKAERLA